MVKCMHMPPYMRVTHKAVMKEVTQHVQYIVSTAHTRSHVFIELGGKHARRHEQRDDRR